MLVLNAPASFEAELAALDGMTVLRDAAQAEMVDFALAFATTQAEVDEAARTIAANTVGDAVVWFAYPKGSSKRYSCGFNRDTGWALLGELGFEGVRQVAIDEDWSALRFRRVAYIKTITRAQSRAGTAEGKRRTTGS
jgi:hypothetical protein